MVPSNRSGPWKSGFQAVFWASAPAGIARGVLLVLRRARPRTKAAQKTAWEAVVEANTQVNGYGAKRSMMSRSRGEDVDQCMSIEHASPLL